VRGTFELPSNNAKSRYTPSPFAGSLLLLYSRGCWHRISRNYPLLQINPKISIRH